jgi:hypothetical protein
LTDLAACVPDAECRTAEDWMAEALEAMRVAILGHPSDPGRSEALMRYPSPRNPDTEH